jgi:hypothetical protein
MTAKNSPIKYRSHEGKPVVRWVCPSCKQKCDTSVPLDSLCCTDCNVLMLRVAK